MNTSEVNNINNQYQPMTKQSNYIENQNRNAPASSNTSNR